MYSNSINNKKRENLCVLKSQSCPEFNHTDAHSLGMVLTLTFRQSTVK